MPINVQCPRCGKKYRAPDKAAGRRIKCPKCFVLIEIKTFQQQDIALTTAFEKNPAHTLPSFSPETETVPDKNEKVALSTETETLPEKNEKIALPKDLLDAYDIWKRRYHNKTFITIISIGGVLLLHGLLGLFCVPYQDMLGGTSKILSGIIGIIGFSFTLGAIEWVKYSVLVPNHN